MRKYIIILSILISMTNCHNQNPAKLLWSESTVNCANSQITTSQDIKVPIAKIILESNVATDLEYEFFFSNPLFYVNSSTDSFEIVNLKLIAGKNIHSNEDDKFQRNFYIEEHSLDEYFPLGENLRGDECYQVEITNMIGGGSIHTIKQGTRIQIGKSPQYNFFIGPTG